MAQFLAHTAVRLTRASSTKQVYALSPFASMGQVKGRKKGPEDTTGVLQASMVGQCLKTKLPLNFTFWDLVASLETNFGLQIFTNRCKSLGSLSET